MSTYAKICKSFNVTNLINANLRGADLSGADLRGAHLINANLRGANLNGADLNDAHLRGADLNDAHLRGANLSGADLRGAHLINANLRGANLNGANLNGADLRSANLRGADLDNITYNYITVGITNIPQNVPLYGFKKVNNTIIFLLIEEQFARSRATTNKCRCEGALVIGIEGQLKNVVNQSPGDDLITNYVVGEYVYPDKWDDDRWNECSHGIHFFLDYMEAKKW